MFLHTNSSLVSFSLQIVLGAVAPVLLFATFEEAFRQSWLAYRHRGSPVAPSTLRRLAYDLVFVVMAATISYQFVDLLLLYVYHVNLQFRHSLSITHFAKYFPPSFP